MDHVVVLVVILASCIPKVSPPEEKKPSVPAPKPAPPLAPAPPAPAARVAPPAGSLFTLYFLCWLIKSQPFCICFCPFLCLCCHICPQVSMFLTLLLCFDQVCCFLGHDLGILFSQSISPRGEETIYTSSKAFTSSCCSSRESCSSCR